MKLRAYLTAALWKVTARNLLGWPTERRHRLSGRYQHIGYHESGRWTKGRLPQVGGPHGRS